MRVRDGQALVMVAASLVLRGRGLQDSPRFLTGPRLSPPTDTWSLLSALRESAGPLTTGRPDIPRPGRNGFPTHPARVEMGGLSRKKHVYSNLTRAIGFMCTGLRCLPATSVYSGFETFYADFTH